jgi:hydrogenase maturation protease
MDISAAKKIADAILYEGYMLYPYRLSAIKNRQRWSFGILYPPAYEGVRTGTERAAMHSECLIEVHDRAALRLEVQLRFLQLARVQMEHQSAEEEMLSRDDSTERTIELQWPVTTSHEFGFAAEKHSAPSSAANRARIAAITRTQDELCGRIRVVSEPVGEHLVKLNIDVLNTTSAPGEITRDGALMRSLLSAHCILGVSGGEFVSLLDPPEQFKSAASACRNIGNFPVLVGAEPARDMMLCSPILLYDYPKIAPESAGDFFDGTEMDEMLTLRVMTLTEDEKSELLGGDDRVRELLERTEMSAREQLARTHGVIRSMSPARKEQ